MKTNTAFNINSNSITSFFNQLFKSIQESKFKVIAKNGKPYLQIPLLLAIVIAIVFPLSILCIVAALLIWKVTISIEQEDKAKENKPQMIEIK